MKKSFIGSLFIWLVIILFACGQKATVHDHEEGQKYTCPMHPQIVQDKPGQCPICGMDLVAMASGNELPIDSALLPLLKSPDAQIAANLPTLVPESGMRIFSVPVQGIISYDQRKQVTIASRINGRVERMYIKYNFQPVRKGQLIMEVYSPELAAAQRELIYISRNDNNPSLLQRARQRLLLLGMQPAQIERVIRSGSPLYRVPVFSTVSGFIVDETSLSAAPLTTTPMAAPSGSSSGEADMNGMGAGTPSEPSNTQAPVRNSPVLVREGQYVSAGQPVFTIYQQSSLVGDFYFEPTLASYLKRGQKMTYSLMSDPEKVYAGSVGLVEPTQRNGNTFITARVYINNASFQPGQLLTGRIPVVARGWWLPESAVVGLGNSVVVFKKEGSVFVPRKVPTGIRSGGLVQITDSVARWQVAKNASFLVGSESFIQTSE